MTERDKDYAEDELQKFYKQIGIFGVIVPLIITSTMVAIIFLT